MFSSLLSLSLWYYLFLTLPTAFCEPQSIMVSSADTLKLATFNIRYGHPQNPSGGGQWFDGERPWYARREGLADQVVWEEPDVIGFQEVLNNQLEDLGALLAPAYAHVGVGRDDGKTAGEAVPLFWRTDRVKLLDVQHFWLSDKPEVVGSIGWDAGLTRMATLAHFAFLSESAEDFYVLNTHYDDRGVLARQRSSELIVAKLNALMSSTSENVNKLVVVLGDLNSPAEEEGYRVLTGHRYTGVDVNLNTNGGKAQAHLYTDANANGDGTKSERGTGPVTFLDARHALSRRNNAHTTLAGPYGEKDTYTGFSTWTRTTLIDHILVADNDNRGQEKRGWGVAKYGVLPNHFGDGVWVSDHRMVVVTLRKRI